MLPNLYLGRPYLGASLEFPLGCTVLAESGDRPVEGLLFSVLHQSQ
jgi:hypothetical protein